MEQLPVAQQVLEYIKRKPYVQEALEQGIINYSALARQAAKEMGINNVETVKAALIRHSKKIRKEKKNREKKIIQLLQQANFSIKNKIVSIHSSTPLNVDAIAYSKTPSGYMYFLDEQNAAKIKHKHINHWLAIIHIKSSINIEQTPGVAAFILSALASEDINVVHLMDCREDTFLVIKEYDAPLAFKVLSEKLRV